MIKLHTPFNWVKPEERLPPQNSLVIVHTSSNGGNWPTLAYLDDEDHFVEISEPSSKISMGTGYRIGTVVVWTHLPTNIDQERLAVNHDPEDRTLYFNDQTISAAAICALNDKRITEMFVDVNASTVTFVGVDINKFSAKRLDDLYGYVKLMFRYPKLPKKYL